MARRVVGKGGLRVFGLLGGSTKTPLKHALAHSSLITGLMMVMSPLLKAVSSLSSLAAAIAVKCAGLGAVQVNARATGRTKIALGCGKIPVSIALASNWHPFGCVKTAFKTNSFSVLFATVTS